MIFNIKKFLKKRGKWNTYDVDRNGRKKVLDLFEKMPSLYCFFHLTDARDRDLRRPIKVNDTSDIRALSAAIPYCDITLADGFFVQAARQEKLDTIFGRLVKNKIIVFY